MKDKRKQYRLIKLFVDILIILSALIISRLIRAQFPDFLFQIRKLIIIIPLVLLVRILVNTIFEHYKYIFYSMTVRDIIKIFLHNLFPSVVFIGLRFISTISELKIPVSMIISEYFLTTTGMIFFRYILVNTFLGKAEKKVIFEKKEVLLISSINSLKKNNRFLKTENISAILSPHKIEWETDFNGIRVIGGYNMLENVFLTNEKLMKAVFNKSDIDSNFTKNIEILNKFDIETRILDSNGVRRVCTVDLLDSINDGIKKTPEEVANFLKGKNILIYGAESKISEKIKDASGFCDFRFISIFSEIEQRYKNDPDCFVIDLSIYTLFERGFCEKNLAAKLEKIITNIKKERQACNYLMIFPEFLYERIIGKVKNVDTISFLFIDMIFPEGKSYPYGDPKIWFDTFENLTGFILKSVYEVFSGGNDIFIARSYDSISGKTLRYYGELIDYSTTEGYFFDDKRNSRGRELVNTSFFGLKKQK